MPALERKKKSPYYLFFSKIDSIFVASNIAMQTLYQTYYSLTKPLPDNGSEAPPPLRDFHTSLVTKHLRNTHTQATGLEPLACFFCRPGTSSKITKS